MGKKGRDIVGLDVENLVQLLNEALAEEWLAYYQYWVGAKVIEGPMRSEVEPELIIHAQEELAHAELVSNRIVQLGGTPVLSPMDWQKLAKCKYDAPEDPYIKNILMQNIDAEGCAIQRYSDLANLTYGKDHATYQMVVSILNDELEHEHDLTDWLNDFNLMIDEIKGAR
jgi:bacterioferritin